jgi:hypothetical protein
VAKWQGGRLQIGRSRVRISVSPSFSLFFLVFFKRGTAQKEREKGPPRATLQIGRSPIRADGTARRRSLFRSRDRPPPTLLGTAADLARRLFAFFALGVGRSARPHLNPTLARDGGRSARRRLRGTPTGKRKKRRREKGAGGGEGCRGGGGGGTRGGNGWTKRCKGCLKELKRYLLSPSEMKTVLPFSVRGKAGRKRGEMTPRCAVHTPCTLPDREAFRRLTKSDAALPLLRAFFVNSFRPPPRCARPSLVDGWARSVDGATTN